ncbi:MAG: hypothetical protein FD161_2024 [Limisphaerales bacterium]|nr:MAG: hypothetical protein FD161_2024 [Limisphaerales bacterium]KAG0509064.1 MAG: hypothetical protein E1N63_1826 [Limisphaerales bacterium]
MISQRRFLFGLGAVALGAAVFAGCATFNREAGFLPIFDGKTLNGWKLLAGKGEGYGVKDGVLYCAKGGGGNLLSEREYSDFIFRFEFKLEAGGNNGIALRAPLAAGSLAYLGMESQILDDTDPKYAKLKAAQYHGSIYLVAPAKRGALRPVGEWNEEEIYCRGRHLRVTVNGKVTVDVNLNDVTDRETLQKHPGMLRDKGHLGFLGHNDYVEFRNLRLKELPVAEAHNVPPKGFKRLFNGENLEGWKGLVADPIKRAKMSKEELAAAQAKADDSMAAHWGVADGMLIFDGKGQSICTARDYGDVEILCDWKIEPKGDSGLYIRGTPQIQIWERDTPGNPKRVGSGGLYNNQKNPSVPGKWADHAPGLWNRFRILSVGDKVHVFLNDELVVNNVTMENYWDRTQPLFPFGQIELQAHGSVLYFRNLYIRELAPAPAAAPVKPAAPAPKPAAKPAPPAKS